jgi:hypothetical protein
VQAWKPPHPGGLTGWKCSDKLEKLKAFVLKEQFAKYAANEKMFRKECRFGNDFQGEIFRDKH